MTAIQTVRSAIFCLAAAGTPALAADTTAWRLFVADQASPVVRVVDPVRSQTIAEFDTKGPAALALSDSGRTVFAIQGTANVIQALSTGIRMADHGDHGDLKVEQPALLPVVLAGAKPSHVVDHEGSIALFFDGEGGARIATEDALLAGRTALRDVKTAAPHHGVAVAAGDHVLITQPNLKAPDELPVGIRVVDKDGAAGDVHPCPELHGEAASGDIVAIACADGLLIAKAGKDKTSVEMLPYPDSLPKGKSTTLRGGKGLQYFLGNYGPSAVVLIDPTAADAFRLIRLPSRRVHFAVDPIRPKFAYVFTEDGKLHQIDVIAGSIVKSIGVTDPYSMEGHWNDPRPRIAVAGDEIAVTDPLHARLHLIDAASFAKAREIAVPGKPYNIVAVGGSGEGH